MKTNFGKKFTSTLVLAGALGLFGSAVNAEEKPQGFYYATDYGDYSVVALEEGTKNAKYAEIGKKATILHFEDGTTVEYKNSHQLSEIAINGVVYDTENEKELPSYYTKNGTLKVELPDEKQHFVLLVNQLEVEGVEGADLNSEYNQMYAVLQEEGILSSYKKKDTVVTKGEAAFVLHKVYGGLTSKTYYKDTKGKYYHKAVNALTRKGIIETDGNVFAGSKELHPLEFIQWVRNAGGLVNPADLDKFSSSKTLMTGDNFTYENLVAILYVMY